VIFTRTKRAAAKLVEELNDRGFNAAAVHGDLNQEQRERAMAAFKAGKKDILIATDVAARGIDVDDVTHVINHTIPEDHDAYLHRVGRTGRAGKTGIAVTFVDWDDMHKWSLINKALDMGQPEPRETYSSSPHLYTDLGIPEDAKGRLKTAGPAKEREPRSANASASGRGGDRSGSSRGGNRDGAPRNRTRTRGGASGSSRAEGARADSPRSETHQTAEGAGTHDGTGPSRRRRNRTRRPSTGSNTPPPAA
jgi:superfamily II DNA/RNA helicase